MSALRPIVAALMLAGLLGCGPDAGRYAFVRDVREDTLDTADTDTPLDADGVDTPDAEPPPDYPLEDWDETDAGPLTGIFAVEVRVKALVAVVELESRQIFRFRLLQRGREVRVKAEMCRMMLPSVQGLVDLTIPPALEALFALKATDQTGEVLDADEPTGATFAPDPILIVVGADLADPVDDPLPTADALDTAVDEDGDGNPGVTLDADAIVCSRKQKIYVALRTIATLSGVVEDPDTIRGDVDATLNQSVLGYSHDCMAVAADLAVEVLPGSTFEARRVGTVEDLDANGNVSCDELLLAAPAIFGAAWE